MISPMAEPSSRVDYGTTRNHRPSVSDAEFERTADALLAAGDKPGLENGLSSFSVQ